MALFAAILMVVGGLQVAVASAQDDAEAEAIAPPVLMLVDALDDPYVLVQYGTEPSTVGITIDGQEAETGTPVALSDSDIAVQTAIVIDNSAASSEYLESFIDAAEAYVAGAGPNEEISVWTTGGVSRLRIDLNDDHARIDSVIESIVTAAGGNMLYDGLRAAALDLGETGAGATNILVFAGAIDGGSISKASEARGAAQAAEASGFAVAADDSIVATLRTFVSSTYGGAFAATDVPEEIAGYGASVSHVVNNTWQIPFESEALASNNQLNLAIDDVTIRASYTAGSISTGSALAPFAEKGDSSLPLLGFLQGDTGRLIGLLFGAVAAGLGAYALVSLTQKDESALNSVLRAYEDPYGQPGMGDDEEEGAIAKNAILKRAVQITEDLAERRGLLARFEQTLEQADLPLRAGEALTAGAGITVGLALVGLLLTGGWPGMLVFAGIGALLPGFAVRFKAGRRQKAFMAQLPDTLQLLSSTLKAGYSFMQGVEAVSQEVDDPMGGELRRIVTEAQLGRPLEESMEASAERMDSPDFAWAVMAVKIQREVGGNLSELLLTVAETMTERERLRRDVATLTAEGKMSAIVLGALPILLGMAMWAINPTYINTLFTDGFGKILLGASIVAALTGFAWMKKIINIDI